MITDSQKNYLKKYFENLNEIAFAFLFGSQTGRNATKLSDVDIAVYFYPIQKNPIEFEAEIYYDCENKIWSDVERILKKEVDLVVLNRVSASVAASAIKGVSLAINDWGLYLDFMEVVVAEAYDYLDFIINHYREREVFAKRS